MIVHVRSGGKQSCWWSATANERQMPNGWCQKVRQNPFILIWPKAVAKLSWGLLERRQLFTFRKHITIIMSLFLSMPWLTITRRSISKRSFRTNTHVLGLPRTKLNQISHLRRVRGAFPIHKKSKDWRHFAYFIKDWPLVLVLGFGAVIHAINEHFSFHFQGKGLLWVPSK